MKLEFSKMHGCGNDYIYINCLNGEIENPEKVSIELSKHHFSVGADGVVLICKSNFADFKMRMFNADGSEGKMCGNAIRCVAKFVVDKGLFSGDSVKIETLSGIKTIEVEKLDGKVVGATVDMGPAILEPKNIPVVGDFTKPIINYPLNVDGSVFKITCVSMGNPHCVVFCDNLNKINLFELGPKFEHHLMFKNGVNTEFVRIINKNEIEMRVWERGSGQTLACGTGACASVVACVLNGYCNLNSKVAVNLLGGKLWVCQTEDTVFLTGGAVLAFEGVVEI